MTELKSIQASGRYVVIKPFEKKTTTEAGIYIPETVTHQSGTTEGTIVSIGEKVELTLFVGDHVVFPNMGSIQTTDKDGPVFIVQESSIYARRFPLVESV